MGAATLDLYHAPWTGGENDFADELRGEPIDLLPPQNQQPSQPLRKYVQENIGSSVGNEQPILEELAAECDRLQRSLQQAENGKFKKPEQIAAMSSRRVSALKVLIERFDKIHERGSVDSEISAIAMVVRLLQDVLKEVGLPQDARELVRQNLLLRVAGERERLSKI